MISATMCTALLLSFWAAPGTVEGSLTVNGTDIKISHVYSLYHDDEDKVLLDGPETRDVFTDREIDPSLLELPSLFNLQAMARDGKLQGVILNFDPKEEPITLHGTLLHVPADPTASMPFFSLSGTEYGEIKVSKDSVEGRAKYASEVSSTFPDMPAFTYDFSFKCDVAKMPPVSEKLQGAAAAKSAQAKALLDFEHLVLSGDLDAARKLATSNRMAGLDEIIKQVGKDEFLGQAKQFIPDTATRAKQISLITVRGKRAVLNADEGNGVTTFQLVKEGDAWKVD